MIALCGIPSPGAFFKQKLLSFLLVELLDGSPGSRVKYAGQRFLLGPENEVLSELLEVPAATVFCSEAKDTTLVPASMPINMGTGKIGLTWHVIWTTQLFNGNSGTGGTPPACHDICSTLLWLRPQSY